MPHTKKTAAKKIILLGAGGREFHNFNVCFKNNPAYTVIGFTAAQIPNIADRIYPPELSGLLYPSGIPIFQEEELTTILEKYDIEEAIFAYSDISHIELMHKASRVLSRGCNFSFLGPRQTMLKSATPVVAVCAVRTGCGKSNVTMQIAKILRDAGKNIAVVRHPMPYGDLKKQTLQRFQKSEDLFSAECTIEEREEYEPLIREGFTVFAGVDYRKILTAAENEADVILWDGGNNDFPFFKPTLHVVICDPHRPGHELLYHPGETNLRMADLVIVNKTNTADPKNIKQVLKNIKSANPKAKIALAQSIIAVDRPELIRNRSVLVVEDGPTVTHGEMSYGAGYLAAKKYGAKKIIEPKRWAHGELKKTFEHYPHLKSVLPAVGYGPKQVKNLEELINAIPCQTVVVATPIDIGQIIKINKPVARTTYAVSGIKKVVIEAIQKYGIV